MGVSFLWGHHCSPGLVGGTCLPFSAFSIDCAGILKLRNSDIELRKGETDIGRKNTRVRLVFRVHVPQGSGKVISVQTASVPIECCEQRGPVPALCLLPLPLCMSVWLPISSASCPVSCLSQVALKRTQHLFLLWRGWGSVLRLSGLA